MKLYFVFDIHDCANHFSIIVSSCVFRPYLVSAVCVAVICYWESNPLYHNCVNQSNHPFQGIKKGMHHF
nr:MAG TPA: hypothetical protein [Caudoviricetes sp.]DAV33634.1 MAG TPA: hypothetical protein [Bacteriophage sp.]